MTTKPGPIWLAANQPAQFYRGGANIAALRGASGSDSAFGPEDWVGSTTTLFAKPNQGLSTLPDGRVLLDAVGADPIPWLGPRHVDAFATSTMLLVKLLDAGQRLPVHFHPSDSFAQRHFDSHFGKAEAWIVIATEGDDPKVHAGLHTQLNPATIEEWVREQNAPAMLDALNTVSVVPGDTVYIPPGLPHAIGAGVFVIELQQPTDFSITVEWRDFLDAPERGHLGIGFPTALGALDTSGWDAERLDTLIRHTSNAEESTVDLLADGADYYFLAERIRPDSALALDPSFAVLIALEGEAVLRTEHGSTNTIRKGDTVLVPHCVGQVELHGRATIVRCRPPSPSRSTPR